MLQLKRRANQSIVLFTGDGERIEIVVDRYARLGISAPASVVILKAELLGEEPEHAKDSQT
jgi:sRNA-binding carbon storage regulator CsrA